MIRRYWDWRAASFHADTELDNRDEWRRVYQTAAETLLPDRTPPLEVLDVGTGAGFVALRFAELGHHVTAVDASPGMLAQAKAAAGNHGVQLRLLPGDAHPLPPLEGTFDLVTCRNVLWTLPDPAAALAGWREVLRPGGAVLVADGIWHTWSQQLGLLGAQGIRHGQPVGWRFLRDYLGPRRRLPYWRGVGGVDARRLLQDAGLGEPQHFEHLFTTHPYPGAKDFTVAGARQPAP